jgi:exosortase
MTLLLGGRQAMRWAWPSIAFLVFMLPLPSAMAVSLSHPLQRLATVISVNIIQMLGIPAAAYGNVIELTNSKLEVARACSGLRMLTLFFAVCVGAAFVIRGPLWEKLAIVLSAIPIALISNASRIVLTAIQREVYSTEKMDELMHDVAGYAMMPLAMLLTFGVIILLQKMFPVEPEELPLVEEAKTVGVPAQARVRRPVRPPRPPRSAASLARPQGAKSRRNLPS